jgi:hypothetical protein
MLLSHNTKQMLADRNVIPFNAKDIKISRNSLAIEPTQGYSVGVSPSTFAFDRVVSKGATVQNSDLVLNYDFKNKIAGSTVECPMKVYRGYNANILTPTDTTWWSEYTDQPMIDKLKTQDNKSAGPTTTANGYFHNL